MLRFEPEGHKYFWGDKEVPSVSQILKKIGITRDYDRVDEYYRQRGTYVHQAIQFHVEHKLDEESVDKENILPYLRAFQAFESEAGYMVKKSEVPLYSEEYGFAGTIDQISEFEDSGYVGEGIADLKATANSDKAADLQLCLYAVLYHENYKRWPAFRMVLELHGDQTSSPIFYSTDPEKLTEAVMALWDWKKTRREKST